jgi:hypothetical protein
VLLLHIAIRELYEFMHEAMMKESNIKREMYVRQWNGTEANLIAFSFRFPKRRENERSRKAIFTHSVRSMWSDDQWGSESENVRAVFCRLLMSVAKLITSRWLAGDDGMQSSPPDSSSQ